MFIPSALVLSPLGGSGGPATVFALAVMCWYLALWVHPEAALDRERQPIRAAAIILFGAVVASYVAANQVALPVLELNGADRGVISMAGCLGVLLIAADGIGGWDQLLTLVRRIVTCGTALATIGITQFFTGLDVTKYIVIPGLITKVPLTDLMVRGGLNRPAATTAQPLEFAAVLLLCLPLALHQARFAAAGWRRRRWLQVALIGAAVPMTISRAAVFGLAAVTLVLLPTWRRRDRRAAYLIVLSGVGLLWAAVPSMLTEFHHLFGQLGADPSSQSRIGAYSAAIPYIASHPWLGTGLGTFLPQTYFFTDNQYLNSLIETGFLGLLALLALLATGWCAARSARRKVADGPTRDLLQSFAASVAVAAVVFATFDAFSFTIATGLTFVLLGCVGAAWRLARAQQ